MWAWGFNIMKTSTMIQNIDLQVFFKVKASLYTWSMDTCSALYPPEWGWSRPAWVTQRGRGRRGGMRERTTAAGTPPETAELDPVFRTLLAATDHFILIFRAQILQILRSIMMFYKVFMKTHSSEKYFNTLPLKIPKMTRKRSFCVWILMFSLFNSLYEQTGDSITYHTHSQLDHFISSSTKTWTLMLEFKLKKLINGWVAYKGYTT